MLNLFGNLFFILAMIGIAFSLPFMPLYGDFLADELREAEKTGDIGGPRTFCVFMVTFVFAIVGIIFAVVGYFSQDADRYTLFMYNWVLYFLMCLAIIYLCAQGWNYSQKYFKLYSDKLKLRLHPKKFEDIINEKSEDT